MVFVQLCGPLIKISAQSHQVFWIYCPKQPKKNEPNWVLNQTKSLFFPSKVESSRYPEAGTWHPESIDGWSYFRLCENFWCPLDLAPEGNLDPVFQFRSKFQQDRTIFAGVRAQKTLYEKPHNHIRYIDET